MMKTPNQNATAVTVEKKPPAVGIQGEALQKVFQIGALARLPRDSDGPKAWVQFHHLHYDGGDWLTV